ncbi:hypothetical protein UR09_01155 [Candidatus Nitromaritima sp. SCGC AAA799-A02]|nr:hypothetical protein UR09_01155 [Candidatus Nitromaritima sp. SCGC AAA799-A02]
MVELLDRSDSVVSAEGLKGASRSLFLSRLAKLATRPIVVLTPDQNTGEALLGDLKYFSRYEKSGKAPRFFPTWELLPYEHLSPLAEISGERLEILNLLQHKKIPFLVVPVEAAMQCVIPRLELAKLTFPVSKGETLERELLETCLSDNGYTRLPMVENRGEFSVRGDIVDIFPPASSNPWRIEFFGDAVESIREFDISSQVSIKETGQVEILPVREVCPSPVQREEAAEKIIQLAEEQGSHRAGLHELLDKVRHLGSFSGMENLAPFFYSRRETLFDYLSDDAMVVFDEEDAVRSKIEHYHALIHTEYAAARDRGDAAAPPKLFYMPPEEMNSRLAEKRRVSINALNLSTDDKTSTVFFDVKPNPVLQGQFDVFAGQAMEWEEAGLKVIVVAPTKGQVKRVHELLAENDLNVDVDRGYISAGFQCPDLKLVFVAEQEIFGRTHKHRYRRKPKSQSFQRGFKDLKPGDFLVHIDYGIGRYLGTRELETGVGGGEFLDILYADDEKLYIPMDGLAFIQKYIGAGEAPPPLNKLGGVSWKRQKNKVKESIREMAEDLLKLYASREIASGYSYSSNPILMQELADSFEYEETEDQLKAIEDTLQDLEKNKPMDRLICGDVGYGKTEVAMRTAFKVVLDKKQVAVLVPTTILAQQHLITFRERFRNYPVNVNMVSRFRSAREQKQILTKLKSGEIDIIIGTHRLLSKDVHFAQLGLIIIDEEQRFGVRHKESLKKLRNTVDILTLTATPIPRTLHFSLMGVRDLSVIETPPVDRLAIKTFVRKFDEKVIREAILRELDRGGQIYFIHNKVKSIHSVKEMVQRIVPEAKIGIGHGQLPERQLEEVMRQFIDREIDVLLCTTIVESGLDIPSANTIIINRADQFGLAQLYQLRGRVGRYRHQAYAYLLIPGTLTVSGEARQRLIAIEELSELGSGFQLAARDMEIRGVGNMLGHNQSGHIASIGFDLYSKLIEETVREIKGEEVQDNPVEPEIDLQVKGFIPKNYIPELNQRLEIYRRLQLIDSSNECEALIKELTDRYGAIPEPVQKLMALLKVKILCRSIHIRKAFMVGSQARLDIEPTTPIVPEKIASLADERMKFLSEFRIGINVDRRGWKKDIQLINDYLKKITEAIQ